MNIGITRGIVTRWLIWLMGDKMKFGVEWNSTSTTVRNQKSRALLFWGRKIVQK